MNLFSANGAAVRLRRFLPQALWILLAVGLLLQALSPRYQIVNRAFVFPQSYLAGEKTIDPAELIAWARTIQILSAVATAGAAIGLAFYYRRAFVRRP